MSLPFTIRFMGTGRPDVQRPCLSISSLEEICRVAQNGDRDVVASHTLIVGLLVADGCLFFSTPVLGGWLNVFSFFFVLFLPLFSRIDDQSDGK